MEEVIKSANSFYEKQIQETNSLKDIKPLSVLLSGSINDLYYLTKVNLRLKSPGKRFVTLSIEYILLFRWLFTVSKVLEK